MRNNKKCHVIGNWKMHGSKEHVVNYISSVESMCHQDNINFDNTEIAVCLPFIYLGLAQSSLASTQSSIKLGAQDVSAHAPGAFTGQIAAAMLVEHNCKYVIIGHSERRAYCQESENEIALKFQAAKTAGLIPILCVGETQEQHHLGLTESVVMGQLQSIITKYDITAFKQAIIAYEPIWAIGTGLTATPTQAQQIHHLIRTTLAEYDASVAEELPILYGGSVKASNSADLFEMPDIDGALVGGASLQAEEFFAICQASTQQSS